MTALCLSGHLLSVECVCTGGSMRGRGWKYGSGFVDGIFPVLSPVAQRILEFVQREVDANIVWDALRTLPVTHHTWDDLVNVAVQLRLNKCWDPIILVWNSVIFFSCFFVQILAFSFLELS